MSKQHFVKLTKIASTAFCFIALTGCGFTIVKPHPIGPELVVQIYDQGAPLVSASLKRELNLRRVRSDSDKPDILISLRDERVSNRLLAIDSAQRAAEYQLEHSVDATVREDGERLVWQTFTATRDYTYDESNVLGKSQERQLIRQTLREELANRIIERYLHHTPTEEEPVEADSNAQQ